MEELNFESLEQKLHEYMKTRKKKGEKYPSFFGGSSYKDGLITIYVLKDTSAEDKKEIAQIIPNVVFKEAKVSKQTLYDCYQKMNEHYIKEDVKKLCDENLLADFCVNDKHGNILIGVQDLTPKKEEIFKEIFFDVSDYLAFEETPMPEENHCPGEKRVRFNSAGTCLSGTIGFRAIDDHQQNGFITTTHGGGVINDAIYDKDSVLIGNLSSKQHTGSVDATFVTYANGANVTSNAAHSNHRIQYTIKFRYLKPVVTMDGAVSQATTGAILSHHSTTRFGISDCYRCKYASTNGDSGAPVTLGSYLLGIHISGSMTPRDGGAKYRTHCCKYKNIRNALNIELD